MPRTIKIPGPSTKTHDAEKAISSLKRHPQFPKNASVEGITEQNGRWVAKLKLAGPFPFDDDKDAPSDDGPPSPPKSDDSSDSPSPDPLEALEDEGEPSPDDSKNDGPKSIDDKVEHIEGILNQIAEKLDIPTGDAGESPLPGEDGPEGIESLLEEGPDGPPASHHGPAEGGPPPGPPSGPPGKKPPGRSLKPGEVAGGPGVVPIGSPAFASTSPTQRVASFVASQETSQTIAEAKEELESMYAGYSVKQARAETGPEGKRVIRALLSVHG